MIRKIALAAILFILSASAANAVMVCRLSATDVAFGDVTVTFGAESQANLTSVGAIVLSCVGSGSNDYTITLSTGGGNQYNPRIMQSGEDPLPYNLYSETALSSIWGNGSGPTTIVHGTINFRDGPLVTVSLPVYGRVEPRTSPAAGNYADVIVASAFYSSFETNTTFQVTAHVTAHCQVSATDLNFGSYVEAQLDGQSQIQLVCSDATPWDVGLNGGQFPGGTVARRSMAGPGLAQLDYQLFSNPERTAVWGNTVGSDTVPGVGSGLPQPLSVYGRIPAGERVREGGYADTITVTLTF